MNACLIDTDVLIDHLRGVEKAYRFMRLTPFFSRFLVSKKLHLNQRLSYNEKHMSSTMHRMNQRPLKRPLKSSLR